MWKIEGGEGKYMLYNMLYSCKKEDDGGTTHFWLYLFFSPLLTRRFFFVFFSAAYIFLGKGTMSLSLFPRGSVSVDCGSQ